MDAELIKSRSERTIRELGGKTLDWLPILEQSESRASAQVARRALVMLGMMQIRYGAPPDVIAGWLESNQLRSFLSRREVAMLAEDYEFTDRDYIDLSWYVEPLWAFAWAGQLVPELRVDEPVGNTLASLLPNIEKGEDGKQFLARFRLRPFDEVFPTLDLYFRAHRYARDGELNGYDTGCFELGRIAERRKALEWMLDASIEDWDECPDGT